MDPSSEKKTGRSKRQHAGQGKNNKKKSETKKTHRIDPWGLGVYTTREGNRVDSFRFEIVCVSNFFLLFMVGKEKKIRKEKQSRDRA